MVLALRIAVAAMAFCSVTISLPTNAQAARTETVHIYPQSEPHEHGTATFTQEGSNVVVVVNLTGLPSDASQSVHIHSGTCAHTGRSVVFMLDPLINGRSTTTLKNLDMKFFGEGTYSIGVHTHRSITRHAACGGPIRSV